MTVRRICLWLELDDLVERQPEVDATPTSRPSTKVNGASVISPVSTSCIPIISLEYVPFCYYFPMSNLKQVINQLHTERKKVQHELSRLDAAISALGHNNGSGAIRSFSSRPRRTLSASARKRIAAAQRARWAKWKADQKKAS
jgi:hypothetical protein